jgi:hypothetical protein
MGLLKPKTEKTDHVSRQELDALAAQLDSFRTISTIAVAAIGLAIKGSPGLPDSNPRTRLEKLVAAVDLDSAERATLKEFFKLLDKMDTAESARQFAEAAERARPKRGEEYRVPSWRG